MTPIELHRNRLAHNMPVEAEVLLSLIADHGPLTIMEIVELATHEELGALATIHKYLRFIREADLVTEASSPTDHRIKSLDISNKGVRYLRSLT
jgi:Fe2+ or Zn2+ uptake regulation protein